MPAAALKAQAQKLCCVPPAFPLHWVVVNQTHILRATLGLNLGSLGQSWSRRGLGVIVLARLGLGRALLDYLTFLP